MKRFLSKKLLAAGVVIAGLVAFAGTCTIQHISLTTVGSNDVFAGEVHNDSGASILQHNVAVAFIGYSNNLLDTQIVQPCLRTLPTGGVNYFSAQSAYAASQVFAGLARVNFDSTFKVGTPATGSGTITGLTVNRNGTSLVVKGTFKNLDSTTLTAPNACAVVYSSAGNVIIVGLDQSLADLGQNASDTFSITLTVPNDSTVVSSVNVYVDGLKNNVPILPIQDVGNTVVVGTPTPTVSPTPSATPGAAAKLTFVTQPPASTLYATQMSSIVVAIQDAAGTTTTSTANVTIALTSGTGTAGATLSCTSTLTVAAVNGLATFSGCQIDKAGIGYSLTATSSGLSNGVSSAFNITPGAATKVAFTTTPATCTGGTACGTQPVAAIEDAASNVVWNSAPLSVTLAIGTNPPGTGVLTCTSTLTVTTVNGQATFAGCNITTSGTGYTLTATSGALTAGTSNTFNVTVGAAAKLAFTTQPGNASGHASSATPLTPQPVVTVQDAGGNTVTGSSASITLTSTIGAVACTSNPLAATSGVATFAACWINAAGTGTVTAASTGLTSATSNSITVS